MNRVRKTVLLAVIAALPIGLGILKIYSHLNSSYRLEPLDYIVAAGLILGGLFLFSKPRSNVISVTSGCFIAFELFKAIVDYNDHYDLFITTVAIVYLSIPILMYTSMSTKMRKQ
jgi:hypothetical protein